MSCSVHGCLHTRGKSGFDCVLLIVILCRGLTPVPSGEGIAVLVEAKIEKWTEG